MQPKVRLRQEVVSLGLQRRGQRITVPVRKFFSKEKRPYGLGIVGRLTNRTYRKRIDSFVKQQIEDMDDHRWVEARVPGRVNNRLWPDGPRHPLLCTGRSSPTGSPLCIHSSPSWRCPSMGLLRWGFRSTRRWTW